MSKREETRASCEEKGISWARSIVGDRSDSEVTQALIEWIDEYDRAERLKREREQDQLSAEAIAAAKESVLISEQAARASKQSAKWTMIAAIASLLAVVMTSVQMFVSAKP